MSQALYDQEGFLLDLTVWNQELATQIAQQCNIALTAAHWEVIHALRAFYQQFGLSPAMRPLCKYLKEKLGAEKSSSIYLLQLFPGSPAKLAAKIAGLPKPDNCL
ncbi:MAG: TusE/DsrC/DsvC family sulfur relay protein [Cellvibrionales bacterium]|jgi:tRNA 2-thiouridine synthesizing protein E|nr:TusE/DsrC/DsvC family sulfur relay protein [Cellvibrionales bacterium]MBK8675951.1 TusE/DsrC/DsvC family sulfur relay protein [Cellvibrionales bacterium]